MARRHNKRDITRRRSIRKVERDLNRIATLEHVLRPAEPALNLRRFVRVSLAPSLVDDRRTFHPERAYRPALRFSGVKATVGLVDKHSSQPGRRVLRQTRAPIAFKAPEGVVVCVRRKQRREVLFALNRTGRGSKARRRVRSFWSGVSC